MNSNIQDDFRDFLNSEDAQPSKELDALILNRIKRKLSPSISCVFSKLILIQGIVGTLTLSFCPQFKLTLGANQTFITSMTNHFGHLGCMIICGAIFLGSGAIVSGAILTSAERNTTRKTKYLTHFFQASFALILFHICGGEIFFDIAIAWFVGGLFSSIAGFELTGKIKNQLQSY